jgi:hypothetical protein
VNRLDRWCFWSLSAPAIAVGLPFLLVGLVCLVVVVGCASIVVFLRLSWEISPPFVGGLLRRRPAASRRTVTGTTDVEGGYESPSKPPARTESASQQPATQGRRALSGFDPRCPVAGSSPAPGVGCAPAAGAPPPRNLAGVYLVDHRPHRGDQ